ncbi:MAG: ATP-binding protein [Spirosomataceae bacterium]
MEQIGRDLHDNLGQLLSVAMLQLHMLEGDVAHLPQIRELREVISKTIYELRSLSKSLDGGLVQDFGLVESLSHELLRMRNTQKYQTEITIEGQVYRLEGKKEIVLFRVAQEILNNIMKHAAAKRVQISLHYTSHCFMLVVEDDGKGFDYETFLKNNTSTSGAGLRNIRRRIEILGGTYTISTAEGQGTKIVIKLPISSKIP